ncbi:MAG: LysR family transcriptional regulator [Cyanothece sp. SIO2G6]|nr:LysR family transcriptional regulator [Cyanothece sp. SIO2G6]
MELRHLRYFVAIAQTLHFGRAAEQLGITQPVLSDQIRRLETLLGVQLLYRTKRVVQLTEPGRIFLPEVLRLLHQTETAIATVQRAAQGKLGQLKIGYTGPALYTVLPEILRQFRDRYPEVELSLHEYCTPDQETALLSGELQLGFLHPPIDSPLQQREIRCEPMVVALPENHPLVNKPSLSIKDLAQESFILFPEPVGPNLYRQIMNLCTEAGFSPKIVQEVTPQPTMIGLVAAGIGIAFVSESLKNISRPGVLYRSLQEATPLLKLAIVWKSASTQASDTLPASNSTLTASSSILLDNFLKLVDEWMQSRC